MIPTAYLFEDEEYLLFEGMLSKMKRFFIGRPIEDLIEKPSVQEFIALSETLTSGKKMSFQDKQKILKSLKDKDVKQYLNEVDTVAKKQGAGVGAGMGAYIGGVAGLLASIGLAPTVGTAIATGLIGAAALGVLGSLTLRKLAGIASRWQREGNIRKQTSGIPVSQVQLTA